MAGRPASKPTKAQHAAIVEGRRKGLPWKACAGAAGIHHTTLLKWRTKGEDGEEPYAALVADVEKAEAESIHDLLSRIEAAATETWQAAAWLLERRYPREYGRRIHEHHGDGGGPVKIVCTLPGSEKDADGAADRD